MSRAEFSRATRLELRDRTGGHCANPQCQRQTLVPLPDRGVIDFGNAAHMAAAAEGGPRYDAALTPEQTRAYENGVWLCPSCATFVDKLVGDYPVSLLRQWQRGAEERCRIEALTGREYDVRVDPGTVTRKTRAFLQRVRDLRMPGGRVSYPAFMRAAVIPDIERLLRDCHAMTFDHPLHAQLDVACNMQRELLDWLRHVVCLLRDPNVFWHTDDGSLHRVGWYPGLPAARGGDAETDRLNDCILRIHQLAQELDSFASGGRIRGTW